MVRTPRSPKPLGPRGEAAAARYLKRRGYKILARGDRLDRVNSISWRPTAIRSCSSRSKRGSRQDAGHPADAVDAAKQRRLTRLAVLS